MGYSCRRAASKCVEFVEKLLIDPTGPSNQWVYEGKTYFWERGREQHDGAITGTINVMTSPGYSRKCGSIRVEGDGKLTRWGNIPREIRAKAIAEYEKGEFSDERAFAGNV